MLQRIRHIKPKYWVMILAVVLVVFIAVMPKRFWTYLASTTQGHTLELSMLLLFSVLSVSLIWKNGQKLDAAVFRFFNIHGRVFPWLDNIMRISTELGNSFVTGAVALFLYVHVGSSVAYAFVFGSLLLWFVVESIKAVLRRDRPFSKLKDVRVVGEKARGKSFPSGHTSQAFFTATLLLQYVDGGMPTYALVYAIATFVGLTRMYLGMHYPRDVLGGMILGSFWGVIGMTMTY